MLEAYYNQVRGEIIKKFQSTRDVLEGLKLTRCVRAMNLGEVAMENALHHVQAALDAAAQGGSEARGS